MNSLGMAFISLATIGTAVALSKLFQLIAQRYRIVDAPLAERKHHKRPIPLLGGAAVILAFLIGLIVLWPELTAGYVLPKHLIGICIGSVAILIGGALDDKFDLPPLAQIVFPVIAACALIVAGIGIDYISHPFGGASLRLDTWQTQVFATDVPYFFTVWSDLFTFAWMMGMMYTTKFLDGLDGLVSGVSIIGLLILAGLSLTAVVYQPETATIALLAAAAFFGFLTQNWHPARQFLGESGSVFAGFILGAIAILSGAKIATTLLIMAIPLLDIAWVIAQRLRDRVSLFSGDRRHLHMRLLDAGLSDQQAVLLLYALTAVFGGASLFLDARAKLIALMVAVILFIVLFSILAWRIRQNSADSDISDAS